MNKPNSEISQKKTVTSTIQKKILTRKLAQLYQAMPFVL